MIDLSFADIIVIVLYGLIIILIGYFSSRRTKNTEESYFLADRKLSLPLFVMTSVATWYGGILGIGEFTYRYGIDSWILQGLPYYFFALIFAFLFSKKIRKTGLITIPQRVEQAYNKKISIIASFFIFIIVTPAPYLLMVGIIISLLSGFSLSISLIIGVLISTIYLYKAGYIGDVFTDVVEFVLMFLGFIILLFFSIKQLGDFSYLKNNLPHSYLKPFQNINITYFFVWFLIGLWTFVDPGFHQRSYSAKNEKVAFWGLIISIFLWFLFDFLTTTTGLYARAFLPNLSSPTFSFPMFADKILPNVLKGFFFVALLATVMSTLNSFTFLSAQTFAKDILLPTFRLKNYNSIKLAKLSLLFTSILSLFLIWLIPSVVDLWYTIGSIFLPGLLLIIVPSYYERLKLSNLQTEVLLYFITFLTFSIFVLSAIIGKNLIFIEPMIICLLIGIFTHLILLSYNQLIKTKLKKILN